MKTDFKLNTNGRGYWSSIAKPVHITNIELHDISDLGDFAELRVFFARDRWNTATDGLIYTDTNFSGGLHLYLHAFGFTEQQLREVTYSEQGMQTDDYVSFDVYSDTFISKFVKWETQSA